MKKNELKLPAIRSKMGIWVYYVSSLSFNQVRNYVSPINDELHKSELLSQMIQRSITENYKNIAHYLTSQEERFFNALILAVYDGEPSWNEIRIEDENGQDNYDLGILSLTGLEKIFPVDGQHIFFCLADSTFSSVDVSYGKKGPYMLSGETMMSICKTLETIDFCCHKDAYSDAYTLLRKYRDDLMQYLFVLNVIQNKHGLTDEEAEEFTINSESMMKMIELDVSILVSGERKTDAELAMEKWIYNVLESSENNKDRKQFFDTSKYKSYLVSNNEKVKYIFDNFLVDKWLREDRKLNNYVHANGIRFVMDNYIYQNKKEDKDKELIETLQNITDIFLSLLSVIDSIKFHSSDYLDALEMDMEPQEGSQYWVCPIIVEYMNDRFDKKLLQYIQDNEGNGMQFMAEYYAD